MIDITDLPIFFINENLTDYQKSTLRLKWEIKNEMKDFAGKNYPVEEMSEKYNLSVESIYRWIRLVNGKKSNIQKMQDEKVDE